MKKFLRKQEKMDPKDFYDFSKQVRDAAEKIYDLFERDTLNNILKGKEKPSMWRNITSTLSPKEAEQATELAFAWSAEDSMSSSRFPESKMQEYGYATHDDMTKITINRQRDGLYHIAYNHPSTGVTKSFGAQERDEMSELLSDISDKREVYWKNQFEYAEEYGQAEGWVYKSDILELLNFVKAITESKEKDMKTIRIKEEFQIPGTDVILEKGDRIEVLEERVTGSILNLFQMMDEAKKILSTEAFVDLVKSTMEDYSSEKIIQEFAQDLNDNIGDELQYL